MKPPSMSYTQAIETWLRQHPGRQVTMYQVAELFKIAYFKSATAQNAANGLRKTGIYPVNRHVFADHEFAPSDVTNIHQQENEQRQDQQPVPAAEPDRRPHDYNGDNRPTLYFDEQQQQHIRSE